MEFPILYHFSSPVTRQNSRIIRQIPLVFPKPVSLVYMQEGIFPVCDSPPPPSRFSPGTAVIIYKTGIRSICSSIGSPCKWFASRIAVTVDPYFLASSHKLQLCAFCRIIDGRAGSASRISPTSRAEAMSIPLRQNTSVWTAMSTERLALSPPG